MGNRGKPLKRARYGLVVLLACLAATPSQAHATCDPVSWSAADDVLASSEPAADPPGTFGAGRWPGACWRPYADSSPFNRPLPSDPRVLPNSSEIVQRILGMGPIADLVVAP